MKTKLLLLSLLLGLGTPWIQGADTTGAPRPGSEALQDFAAVEQFLSLTDAELDELQQVLTRIRAMKPEERAALRVEIQKYRALPENQRQQLRQGWGGMPPEIQAAWREMMQQAPAEKHREVQTKLQSMAPEERLEYRRKLVEEYLKAKAERK